MQMSQVLFVFHSFSKHARRLGAKPRPCCGLHCTRKTAVGWEILLRYIPINVDRGHHFVIRN